MTERIDARATVPEWTHVEVQDWDDVGNLGKKNIGSLIEYHRNDLIGLGDRIGTLEEYTELLEGKSGNDLAAIAQQFDNPQFTPEDLSVKRDSWSGVPEPNREEDIDRESNSTTLNKCGWCRYAGSGSWRYKYMVEGSCRLLQEADMETDTHRGAATECSITKMPAKKISRIVERFNQRKTWLIGDLNDKKELVDQMQEVADGSEEKPYLPQLRPYDYFNVDDEVVMYFGSDSEKLVGYPRFINGKVIEGYRHHDGMVSFITDEVWHSGDYHDGKGGGSGANRADILLKSEFDYLTQNPDYLNMWLNQLEEHKDGDYAEFKRAMRDSVVTSS